MPSIRALKRLADSRPPPPPPRPTAPTPAVVVKKEEEESPPQRSSSFPSSSPAPAKPVAPSPAYPLRDFPGREAAGAFRDNVRFLLDRWGPVPASSPWPARRAFLSDDRTRAVVPIVAVEVHAASSPAPLCDFCRRAGESRLAPLPQFGRLLVRSGAIACALRRLPSFSRAIGGFAD
jgi:hypothetical protein